MMRVIGIVSVVVLVYFVLMQFYLLLLALLSAHSLYKERMLERFGRLEDLLHSDVSPPVSIILPAYNEEAGVVEAVKSISMVSYPRFEIVIVNDGSTDATLAKLVEAFHMIPVPLPFRANLPTAAVRQVYHAFRPVPITVVDKVNAGRADALNAGINVARFPYVMLTDADVLVDGTALLKAMWHVVEDRARTVAVGGNVRPLNGCVVKFGHIVEAKVPQSFIERWQLLEYVRSFVASRPAWSKLNCLPLISGAFGIYLRQAVVNVGGLTSGHMGEDMDLTMRIHRYYRERRQPYRMVYAPSAVIWTEVPSTRRVLRRQRIRWHRGLMTAVHDFRSTFLNHRHGSIGMIGWPGIVLFEYVAPIVEMAGYVIVPLSLMFGAIQLGPALLLLAIALLAGAFGSLVALVLDERYGYFNEPSATFRLLLMVLLENLGLRQQTVWWRIRALLGGASTRAWGDMQRRGVGNLGAKKAS